MKQLNSCSSSSFGSSAEDAFSTRISLFIYEIAISSSMILDPKGIGPKTAGMEPFPFICQIVRKVYHIWDEARREWIFPNIKHKEVNRLKLVLSLCFYSCLNPLHTFCQQHEQDLPNPASFVKNSSPLLRYLIIFSCWTATDGSIIGFR